MEKIKEISAFETLTVRQIVLRNGKPLETCNFEGDNLASTRHFGSFFNKKIVGVVSVFKNNNSIFNNENQFQIRGMAVLEEHQKKGYGEQLVKYCELYVLSKFGAVIWFNARESAVRFYEKLGYKIIGNPFIIETIGLHYIMKKELVEAHE